MKKAVIQINNIKLPLHHSSDALMEAVSREGLICAHEDICIIKKSLDSRDKSRLRYVYSIETDASRARLKTRVSDNLIKTDRTVYDMPETITDSFGNPSSYAPPIIVGLGPAGMFAGLILAKAGLKPLIIERGKPVEERCADIDRLNRDNLLNTESNICFGEGGAGTYSDGKLATGIKDREGRLRYILKTFAECGAADEILYWYQPHIGSDVLPTVVKNIRNKIKDLGGVIYFSTKLTDINIKDNRVTSVTVEDDNGEKTLGCENLILSCGHSARDVFELLKDKGAAMERKAFALGVRIEHPQEQIQLAQFGTADRTVLPSASYKLTGRTEDGRGVYSFCMCPGGHVVNASTEDGMMTVNGMSLSGRDGRNANSAIVVAVGAEDFGGEDVLSGLAFQRKYESLAFQAGQGRIPVQLSEDFIKGRVSQGFGAVIPDICADFGFADLNRALPEAVSAGIKYSLHRFAGSISRYDRPDAVLSGIESRTSSPVRILRDEYYEGSIKGLFPCGEGAGYAGGIMSAAADGMKVAEEVIRRYRNE